METTTPPVLTIERTFNAPLEKVWRAWSDPEAMKKWWGPKDFTAPVIQMDFRVGGKFLGCMHGRPGPDAAPADFWSTGTYKEIIPMEKIISTDSFADKDGNIVPSSAYGMEGMPEVLEIEITFKEIDGKTHMTLNHIGMPEAMQEMCRQGWEQSFDKLEESVK